MQDFRDRLRTIRQRRGYVRAVDAARAFGWTQSTYLGHENGDRMPSREAAERYAKAYRVPVGWLLSGEGSIGDDDPDRLARAVEAIRLYPPQVQEQAATALETLLAAINAASPHAPPANLDVPETGNRGKRRIGDPETGHPGLEFLRADRSLARREKAALSRSPGEPANHTKSEKGAPRPARKS